MAKAKGRAKSMVMQRQYRTQTARDKTAYRRKVKHRKRKGEQFV